MKFIIYYEENCGKRVILDLNDTLGSVESFFTESEPGDKCHLKIVEMSEEEYYELPESEGC